MNALRADLYHYLAELLAEPPEWLRLPGYQWPLYGIAVELADGSEAAALAVGALAQIEAEPLPCRNARYADLFLGAGRPRFWLHESMYLKGRLLGSETAAVAELYRAAGLVVTGAELPDHASIELAFLAYLAERSVAEPELRQKWLRLERQFIRRHAGRWLPALGRSLASSTDAVYAPVGALLTGWLGECERPLAGRRKLKVGAFLPVVKPVDACTLCGFCVQVCPTRALTVRESGSETALLLSISDCVHCSKCQDICATEAINMVRPANGVSVSQGWTVLRRSPRVMCPGCGEATISRAEMEFVASRIGRPTWLEYCLSCRCQSTEVLP